MKIIEKENFYHWEFHFRVLQIRLNFSFIRTNGFTLNTLFIYTSKSTLNVLFMYTNGFTLNLPEPTNFVSGIDQNDFTRNSIVPELNLRQNE